MDYSGEEYARSTVSSVSFRMSFFQWCHADRVKVRDYGDEEENWLVCQTRVLFGRLFIATPSSISSTTASSVWRNLNGTKRNSVREKERSLCQGRKGPRHAERERVGHRFPTFLEKASIAPVSLYRP